MADVEGILARLADVEAILARFADGDPTLIVPALAAAAVLLTIAGAAGLLARRDPIAVRLATGVSGPGQAAPATCRCRAHAAATTIGTSPLAPSRRGRGKGR